MSWIICILPDIARHFLPTKTNRLVFILGEVFVVQKVEYIEENDIMQGDTNIKKNYVTKVSCGYVN